MTLVDLAIVIVLTVAAIVGLVQGLVRSVFSLAGLVLGLSLACWNYGRPAALLKTWIHSRPLADTIGFLAILLTVMLIASVVGWIIAKIFRFIGMGWIDMMGGAALGFMFGAMLVTATMVISVAFFPKSDWMAGSKLPPMFFSVCDQAMEMSPADMSKRVRDGLADLQERTPSWLQQ